MSPNVGNFVHDLVEMAKAMETLPGVQAELDKAHDDIEAYAKQVQRLEMKLMERSAEIEAMHSKVREAEAGRDQAETMFLELDEKAHKVLSALGNIQANLNDAKNDLDPPKPEPVAEARPVQVPDYIKEPVWDEPNNAQGPSASPPSAEPSPIPTAAPSTPAPAEAATTTGGADVGVSVPQDLTADTMTTQSGDAQTTSVEPAASVPTSTSDQGVSVEPTPTQAPPAATGTWTEPVASASDPEPTRFEWVNGIKQTRDAWYAWYDAQPYEYKRDFDWNAA